MIRLTKNGLRWPQIQKYYFLKVMMSRYLGKNIIHLGAGDGLCNVRYKVKEKPIYFSITKQQQLARSVKCRRGDMSFTADISKSVRREVYGLKNVPKVRCRYGIRMSPHGSKTIWVTKFADVYAAIVISKLMCLRLIHGWHDYLSTTVFCYCSNGTFIEEVRLLLADLMR